MFNVKPYFRPGVNDTFTVNEVINVIGLSVLKHSFLLQCQLLTHQYYIIGYYIVLYYWKYFIRVAYVSSDVIGEGKNSHLLPQC